MKNLSVIIGILLSVTAVAQNRGMVDPILDRSVGDDIGQAGLAVTKFGAGFGLLTSESNKSLNYAEAKAELRVATEKVSELRKKLKENQATAVAHRSDVSKYQKMLDAKDDAALTKVARALKPGHETQKEFLERAKRFLESRRPAIRFNKSLEDQIYAVSRTLELNNPQAKSLHIQKIMDAYPQMASAKVMVPESVVGLEKMRLQGRLAGLEYEAGLKAALKESSEATEKAFLKLQKAQVKVINSSSKLGKFFRGAKVVGGVILLADAVGHIYILESADAEPSLAPVGSWAWEEGAKLFAQDESKAPASENSAGAHQD